MRLRKHVVLALLVVLVGILSLSATVVRAQSIPPSQTDIIKGALLYDNWPAALSVQLPQGNMPIWSRQSTNTRSGPDTWRCVECHGWDYRGAQGAYATGSHQTGFPDVRTLASSMSEVEIVGHLKGSKDPAHDFSAYLDEQSMLQLAVFLKYGTADDSLYINAVSLKMIGGDSAHGQALFDANCAVCHGTDGAKIVFRSEGVNEALGDIAARDPWRFLHRTRYGTAGTEMPIGATLGWSVADGRDVVAYAQNFTKLNPIPAAVPASSKTRPQAEVGIPGNYWLQGLVTSLLAFLGAVMYAALFIAGFLVMGLLVVLVLRRKS